MLNFSKKGKERKGTGDSRRVTRFSFIRSGGTNLFLWERRGFIDRVIGEKAKRLAIREDLKTFLLTSANEDDKERILLERKEDGCNRREGQIFLNRVLTFG